MPGVTANVGASARMSSGRQVMLTSRSQRAHRPMPIVAAGNEPPKKAEKPSTIHDSFDLLAWAGKRPVSSNEDDVCHGTLTTRGSSTSAAGARKSRHVHVTRLYDGAQR